MGEGNRSPPDRPPSSPLLPTGYRERTQSSGGAEGGDHRSRSSAAGQSAGICHPMVRPATCASHTWCIPAAISMLSSIFALSRSHGSSGSDPAHAARRTDAKLESPDASPSLGRVRITGILAPDTGVLAPDAPPLTPGALRRTSRAVGDWTSESTTASTVAQVYPAPPGSSLESTMRTCRVARHLSRSRPSNNSWNAVITHSTA